MGEGDVQRLLGDAGIVRSRAKIDAAITGARAYLALQEGGGDFAHVAWLPLRGPGDHLCLDAGCGLVDEHVVTCFRHSAPHPRSVEGG